MSDLQRELSRTKEDLAAAQLAAAQHVEHISDSTEMDPYTSGASKGKEPARLYTFDEPIRQESPVDHPVPQESTPRREQTMFSMREQTPALSAAHQEAAAVRYLSFVEDMTK